MDAGGDGSAREKVVHFVPLGGLGQIGMNCFALEEAGNILLVDCGATFPEDDVGEDLLVPDLRWLLERRSQLTSLFITHGHEDHIGAVPHLLRALSQRVTIYAPAHAAALIAARLEEQGLRNAELRVVRPGESYSIGPFVVEPIRVAHSIVEATSLCIDTSAGRIIHTADFDLDESQPTGWQTDTQRFQELGQAGVRLLLSDSTNIDSDSRGGDETSVAQTLQNLVLSSTTRVVVSCFSSNVHRIVALLQAAEQSGRRVCLLGRSLRRHFDIAHALGHISYPSHLLVAQESLAALPREQVLVLAGGSQGEVNSALFRLAQGTHPHLRLEQGDQVIFSVRVIPGNERAVYAMHNDLIRQGVQIITYGSHPGVHVSGHASRSELRAMLQWVQPRSFIPVHGTLGHMQRHAALARSCGVADIMVVENGSRVGIPLHGPLTDAGRVPFGITRLVEGGQELDGPTRRQRFALARAGVIAISAQLNEREQLIGRPQVTSRGVVGVDADEGAHNVIESCIVATVERVRGERMRRLLVGLANAVRSVVIQLCGARPKVLVLVFGGDGVERTPGVAP
jgi:ribonuclease J